MAEQVADVFTEVILAPAYEDGAVDVLAAKKNIRILVVEPARRGGAEIRTIDGGLLMQRRDTVDADHDRPAGWQLAAGPAVGPEVLADLEFAWQACLGGEVERHPAGPGPRVGGDRDGSGQPRRLLPAGRQPGR